MTSLTDLETWRREIGLMPTALLEGASDSYVLTNGAKGNFCLYFEETDPLQTRHDAWSANVGHAVSLFGDEAIITAWDSPTSKYIDCRQILAYPDDFHTFLESNAPSSAESVVAHAVTIFRKLRRALGPDSDGVEALREFLLMLSKAAQSEVGSCWERHPGLSQDERDALLDELKHGASLGLKPDLRLTLRHASGALFQEAHYAAVIDPWYQRPLPGFTPEPARIESTATSIGVYYTPVAIVRTMVEEALRCVSPRKGQLTVLDPACGSGEFLREVLHQLKSKQEDINLLRLVGYDVSESACIMAQYILEWESKSAPWKVKIDISQQDALSVSSEWPTSDLVIMNPPFVSWPDMKSATRKHLKEMLGEVASGRPDFSSAFMWKSISHLAARGVLATVLPSSLLDGTSYRLLRSRVAENLSPILVARLGSHELFNNAQVDASLYVASKKPCPILAMAMWADRRASATAAALRTHRKLRARGDYSTKIDEDGFSLYPTSVLANSGESWSPRPYKEWVLSEKLHNLPRVKDLFKVRQGAITGLNEVFIHGRSFWESLPEDEQLYFRPATVNSSISNGILRPDWFVFYPHGPYEVRSEKTLKKVVPTFYKKKLRDSKNRLSSRSRIDSEKWWVLSEPRAWAADRSSKIISTYFGEMGSFAVDSSGDYVVVHGYAWIPKKGQTVTTVLFAYLALLNSPIFSSLLAAHASHVGGGQWNLSKRYVTDIAIPDFANGTIDMSISQGLKRLGDLISRHGLYSLSDEDRQLLEELSRAAYGQE